MPLTFGIPSVHSRDCAVDWDPARVPSGSHWDPIYLYPGIEHCVGTTLRGTYSDPVDVVALGFSRLPCHCWYLICSKQAGVLHLWYYPSPFPQTCLQY